MTVSRSVEIHIRHASVLEHVSACKTLVKYQFNNKIGGGDQIRMKWD